MKSFDDTQTEPYQTHQKSVQIMPVITALLMIGLGSVTFVGFAASKDHLPGYMQGPALIGGICCILAGIACVLAVFFVNKGEKHWDKRKNQQADDPSSHRHPLDNWPHWLVFGTTMAAILTEGAFLYMLACVLVSNERDEYCFVFVRGESAKCPDDGGVGWIFALVMALVGSTVCAFWFERGMQTSIQRFNYKRTRVRHGQYNQSGQYNQAGQNNQSGNTGSYNDDDDNNAW